MHCQRERKLDLQKRDAEIKLLLGCTSQEARRALAIHNVGSQVGLLLERTCTDGKASND